MIKNMLFPYDKEEYLNRFVSAAVYTCLYRIGDYMKQAQNDASGLYLKKAMTEHKHLVKLGQRISPVGKLSFKRIA